jgi:hypothetical protein
VPLAPEVPPAASPLAGVPALDGPPLAGVPLVLSAVARGRVALPLGMGVDGGA